jgi:hypothetical protein
MGWLRARHWRVRRECASPVSIDLARTRYAAGETVVALVDRVEAPATIALVRLERWPFGERVVVLDERRLDDPYGVAELRLPTAAPPTATGRVCALSYAVQALAGRRGERAGLEVTAEGHAHVASGSSGGDPLIAGWDARHFHLVLDDAVLCGGGWIAGRLDRDGSWGSRAIVVRLRCDECWRPSGPPARGMPYWDQHTLWAAEDAIELDPGNSRAPFRFELPPRLPPAVEARTIAWRYELRAHRQRPLWRDETAALTPLLYDERV